MKKSNRESTKIEIISFSCLPKFRVFVIGFLSLVLALP
jgi:hypothetical protein